MTLSATSLSHVSSNIVLTPPKVQLYLPPDTMINKDFLKLIFQDQKKLLQLSDVRHVCMPKYDELSVRNIFP
jgi:hypothetical protein